MPKKYSTNDAKTFIGQVFGRLTVQSDAERTTNGNKRWLCLCACGSTVIVRAANVKNGNTRSCGCWKRDKFFKHGHARVKNTSPEYGSWECMKLRVRRDALYVKLGVQICAAWRESFITFLQDMGLKPTRRHTIDRIDGQAHYSCGKCADCIEHGWKMNCRWATYAEQNRNLSRNHLYTANGKTLCLTDWAKELHIHPRNLLERLKTWPPEKAFTTPNTRVKVRDTT